jgi:hypothetical protein
MTGPLWFMITLVDCSGQHLATWNYDEVYPVTAPQFTYPNQDEAAPYVLQFRSTGVKDVMLPMGNLNIAIRNAIAAYVKKLEEGRV